VIPDGSACRTLRETDFSAVRSPDPTDCWTRQQKQQQQQNTQQRLPACLTAGLPDY
jgi:hypothetical protein